MRVIAIVAVAVLGVPLAGCISLVASKPVPDWAMNPQAQADEAPQSARKASAARRTTGVRRTSEQTASVTGAIPTNTQPAGLTPFTPEWQAQETAADARLRRQMNICNGC